MTKSREESTLDSDIRVLLSYLLDEVIKIYKDDPLPADATPIPSSYNPPKLGRAYYFQKDGLKVREVRKFSVDKGGEDSGKVTCSKHCAKVAMPELKFLFLWFCPLHEHCYGFHIVNGSISRKDHTLNRILYFTNFRAD